MSLPCFADLMKAADDRAPYTPIVVAGGADHTVIESLALAAERGWVRPILADSRSELEKIVTECGRRDSLFTFLDTPHESAPAAVAEVRAGRAQLLMKGRISTPELMQSVLDRVTGLRTGRTIGQFVLMEIPRDGRRFLMADTGVLTTPTLEQKEDLLRSLVTMAQALGCHHPRIAVMSATEKPTLALPDTDEAVELSRRSRTGKYGDCVVDGPLSFDLAYSQAAAGRKRFVGEVTGAADVMLFPNLLAANLTVKGIMYTADCRFGGVLCGAVCPIVFMSRADSVYTRLHSLALALAVADSAQRAS